MSDESDDVNFVSGCRLCRFSGNSRDPRATNKEIYCRQIWGMVKRRRKGVSCRFGKAIDISPCERS